jgi:hypothetical protein
MHTFTLALVVSILLCPMAHRSEPCHNLSSVKFNLDHAGGAAAAARARPGAWRRAECACCSGWASAGRPPAAQRRAGRQRESVEVAADRPIEKGECQGCNT